MSGDGTVKLDDDGNVILDDDGNVATDDNVLYTTLVVCYWRMIVPEIGPAFSPPSELREYVIKYSDYLNWHGSHNTIIFGDELGTRCFTMSGNAICDIGDAVVITGKIEGTGETGGDDENPLYGIYSSFDCNYYSVPLASPLYRSTCITCNSCLDPDGNVVPWGPKRPDVIMVGIEGWGPAIGSNGLGWVMSPDMVSVPNWNIKIGDGTINGTFELKLTTRHPTPDSWYGTGSCCWEWVEINPPSIGRFKMDVTYGGVPQEGGTGVWGVAIIRTPLVHISQGGSIDPDAYPGDLSDPPEHWYLIVWAFLPGVSQLIGDDVTLSTVTSHIQVYNPLVLLQQRLYCNPWCCNFGTVTPVKVGPPTFDLPINQYLNGTVTSTIAPVDATEEGCDPDDCSQVGVDDPPVDFNCTEYGPCCTKHTFNLSGFVGDSTALNSGVQQEKFSGQPDWYGSSTSGGIDYGRQLTCGDSPFSPGNKDYWYLTVDRDGVDKAIWRALRTDNTSCPPTDPGEWDLVYSASGAPIITSITTATCP